MPPDLEDSHPALKEFKREEESAQEILGRRLAETEARLETEPAEPLRALLAQLSDLQRRLDAAKAEFETGVKAFQEKLASGPVGEAEFRARIVMLDMEYSSRLRLAEEGLKLLSGGLEQGLEIGGSRLRFLVGELRDALRLHVNPARSKLAYAMAQAERRLLEKEEGLEAGRKLVDELREKVRVLEKDREASSHYQESSVQARARAAEEAAREAQLRLKGREDELRALEAELSAQRSLHATQSRRWEDETLALRDKADELERRLEEAVRRAEGLEAEKRELPPQPAAAAAGEPPAEVPAPPPEAVPGGPYAPGTAGSGGVPAAAVLEDAKKAIQSLREEHEAVAERMRRLEEERDAALKAAREAQEDLEASRAGREADLKTALEARSRLEPARAGTGAALPDGQGDPGESVRRLEEERDAALKAAEEARDRLQYTRTERDALQKCLQTAATKFPEAAERMRLRLDEFRRAAQRKDEEIARLKGELARALDETQPPAPPASPSEETSRRIVDAEFEMRRAKEEGDRLQRELEDARKASHDRAPEGTPAAWQAEKNELEELLAAKTREIALLKSEFEASERSWQETSARQDAERMQELFRLRAKIQNLKWAIEEKKASAPGTPVSGGPYAPGTAGSGGVPAAPGTPAAPWAVEVKETAEPPSVPLMILPEAPVPSGDKKEEGPPPAVALWQVAREPEECPPPPGAHTPQGRREVEECPPPPAP